MMIPVDKCPKSVSLQTGWRFRGRKTGKTADRKVKQMGQFIQNRLAHEVTVIPNEFIDRYMAEANGEYVKVYLYILRHGGSADDVSEIAAPLSTGRGWESLHLQTGRCPPARLFPPGSLRLLLAGSPLPLDRMPLLPVRQSLAREPAARREAAPERAIFSAGCQGMRNFPSFCISPRST